MAASTHKYNPARGRLVTLRTLVAVLLAVTLLSACSGMSSGPPAMSNPGGAASGAASPEAGAPMVAFALRTDVRGGKMVYVGEGGAIDGVVNPTLRVDQGALVKITLTNADASEHDIAFPDFEAASERLWGIGSQTTIEFVADKEGEFTYYCTVSGHRRAGMEGKLLVGSTLSGAGHGARPEGTGGAAGTAPTNAASISADPALLPPPIGDRASRTVKVSMEAVELEGRLADGASYRYWTFDGRVPGPFMRVRVGDTVELTLKNRADSHMTHSIDLHAVTGPGGGAGLTQVPPGGEKIFTWQALHPGLFVYHCATPMLAQHLASGMYGMILVEPHAGLPTVDREFYVMQGEIYTLEPYGTKGLQEPSEEKLLGERPDYFLFNGSVDALTTRHPLRARVGETVRIFFGVGGPNFTSSFHLVGEVFDRAYNLGSLTSPPLTDVQTVLVPTGGSAMLELTLQVPGTFMLMDHSLSRAERGLTGHLVVEGDLDPGVFREGGSR